MSENKSLIEIEDTADLNSEDNDNISGNVSAESDFSVTESDKAATFENATEKKPEEITVEYADTYKAGFNANDTYYESSEYIGFYPEAQQEPVLRFFGLDFISYSAYLLYVFFGLVVIILLIVLMISNLHKRLRSKALNCIASAEEEFIGYYKYGKIKRLYAVNSFSKMIPALFRPFLGTRYAEKMIDSNYETMNRLVKIRMQEKYNKEAEIIESSEKSDNGKNVNAAAEKIEKDSRVIISNECDNNGDSMIFPSVSIVFEQPGDVYFYEYKKKDGYNKHAENSLYKNIKNDDGIYLKFVQKTPKINDKE